jgi:dihydroflavonol-4-reductase
MASRPILVTGATGFFGGNLARALCERGERVRVLVRAGRRPIALDGLEYEVAEGDLADGRSLAQAAAGCGHVYHAAASVVFWCRDDRALAAVRKVNVEGTRLLLQAAAEAGIERAVHVSTVDVIGLPVPGTIANEATAWAAGRIRTVYAETKREAEQVALAASLDTVVVSPTFMIGPFDPKPSSGRLLLPLLKGPVAVHPRTGGNNFIDVRDAAAGAIAAMERGRSGERYILGHVNLTYRELFVRALGVLGRRPVLVPLPRAVLVAAGLAMEAFAQVAGGEPALTTGLARLAFEGHYYDAGKAVRELGLPQTPIEVALRDALAWLGTRK